MGSSDIARVDLNNFSVGWFRGVGLSPRHVVLSPGGQYLYATLNGEGHVIKLDTNIGHRGRARRDRIRAAQHGDLLRRHRAVRRELRIEHRHQAARRAT